MSLLLKCVYRTSLSPVEFISHYGIIASLCCAWFRTETPLHYTSFLANRRRLPPPGYHRFDNLTVPGRMFCLYRSDLFGSFIVGTNSFIGTYWILCLWVLYEHQKPTREMNCFDVAYYLSDSVTYH